MCGRFTLHHTTDEVTERFTVEQAGIGRFDTAPEAAPEITSNIFSRDRISYF